MKLSPSNKRQPVRKITNPATGKPLSAFALSLMVAQLKCLQGFPKNVLRAMADHYPDVWPSIPILAVESGWGTTTTRETVHLLEEQKYISAVGSKKGGHLKATQYTINARRILDLIREQEAQRTALPLEEAAQRTTLPLKTGSPTPQQISPTSQQISPTPQQISPTPQQISPTPQQISPTQCVAEPIREPVSKPTTTTTTHTTPAVEVVGTDIPTEWATNQELPNQLYALARQAFRDGQQDPSESSAAFVLNADYKKKWVEFLTVLLRQAKAAVGDFDRQEFEGVLRDEISQWSQNTDFKGIKTVAGFFFSLSDDIMDRILATLKQDKKIDRARELSKKYIEQYGVKTMLEVWKRSDVNGHSLLSDESTISDLFLSKGEKWVSDAIEQFQGVSK